MNISVLLRAARVAPIVLAFSLLTPHRLAGQSAELQQMSDRTNAELSRFYRQMGKDTGDPAFTAFANRYDAFNACVSRASRQARAPDCPSPGVPPTPRPGATTSARLPDVNTGKKGAQVPRAAGQVTRSINPVSFPSSDPNIERLEAQRRMEARVQQFTTVFDAMSKSWGSTGSWDKRQPEQVTLDNTASVADAEHARKTVARTFDAAVHDPALRPWSCAATACRASAPAEVVAGLHTLLDGVGSSAQIMQANLPPSLQGPLAKMIAPWLEKANESLDRLTDWSPVYAPGTHPFRDPIGAMSGQCDRTVPPPVFARATSATTPNVTEVCEKIVQALFALPTSVRQRLLGAKGMADLESHAVPTVGDEYAARVQRALWLARTGSSQSAAVEIIAAIQSAPRRWEGFAVAADLAMHADRGDAATALLRAARTVVPTEWQFRLNAALDEARHVAHADSLGREAAGALVEGNFVRAADLYNLAYAEHASPAFQYGQALAYYGEGLKEPVSTLLRILRRAPDPDVAEHAAAFLDTLYLTGKVDDISTPADSSAERGLAAARLGNWAEALDQFEFAAGDEPQNSRWWRAVGSAHAALKEWNEASEAYLSAAKLSPDDTTSFSNAGVAFYRAGQWTECVAAFQGAVNRAPRDALLRDGMGRCLVKLGDRDGARQAFAAASTLDPSNNRYRTLIDSLSRPPFQEQQ